MPVRSFPNGKPQGGKMQMLRGIIRYFILQKMAELEPLIGTEDSFTTERTTEERIRIERLQSEIQAYNVVLEEVIKMIG